MPEDGTTESTPNPLSSPARNALELAIESAAISAGMNPPHPTDVPLPPCSQDTTSHLPSPSPNPGDSNSALPPPPPPPPPKLTVTHETGVLTSRAFTSFLLSPDNSAFHDDEHDMTKPLPEYYISSSHNTYLVGHQLVGESTIEGYIRALLHSCRSVECECLGFCLPVFLYLYS